MKKRKPTGDSQARQRLALALLTYAQTKGTWFVWWRWLAFGSAFALLILVCVWAGGNLYGVKYDLEGSLLSARSSDAQLETAARSKADDYRLQIIRPDGTHHEYTLQDIGLHADIESSVSIARQKQRAFNNRVQWWRPIALELVIDADHKALEAFIAQHVTVMVEPPRDASLGLVDGTVQLTEAVTGKQYGLKNPMSTILKTASKLQTAPLRMEVVAIQPMITAQTLAETKQNLENILNQNIVFKIDGQEIRPNRDKIAEWLILTPDSQKKAVIVSVNVDAARAYINQIAAKHNRAPRAQVNLTAGGVIPGSTGITVTNTDAAIATIEQDILKGSGLQVDLPIKRTPFTNISAAGFGRWIEIDLTNKRLYAYEQAGLARTFLISAGAPATPTVTGTFAIYSKFTRQTMSGPNADGSRYVQPNVPWVNYFYQDYAIHGNYWRPTSYFGNVNSSHGCVGLLTSDAAWIYNWASIGTPVVVHR